MLNTKLHITNPFNKQRCNFSRPEYLRSSKAAILDSFNRKICRYIDNGIAKICSSYENVITLNHMRKVSIKLVKF